MSDLLLSVLERLPSRVRRVVVAAGALLALAAVMAALTLTAPHGDGQRQPVRQRHGLRACPADLTAPPRAARLNHSDPSGTPGGGALPRRLSAVRVRPRRARARSAASPPALRRQLLHKRAELTPVERRRRPRVVSLQTTATTPTFVVATAVIDDGGVTTYRLRFTLEGRAGRWLVSGVQEG